MPEQKAKPVGRPSKYQPEFCEQVIEFGAQGMARVEWAGQFGVTRQTLANWEAAHPEFLDSTTHARELSAAWWAAQGREGIWSKSFNAVAYRLQVLNRFPDDWRDRQSVEHSGPDGKPIETREVSDEQLEQRHAQLRNRLLAVVPSAYSNGSHPNGDGA